jgi:hypothetical protein
MPVCPSVFILFFFVFVHNVINISFLGKIKSIRVAIGLLFVVLFIFVGFGHLCKRGVVEGRK